MKLDNDMITFLTGVSGPIAIDQCSQIISLIVTLHTKTRLIDHGNLGETGFQTPKTEFPKGF